MAVYRQYLLMLILLVSCASATSFDAEIFPDSLVIGTNQTAEYNLTVWHDSKITQFFEIYSPDVSWDVMTQPLSDRTLRVEPGQEKQTVLRVRPLYVGPGYYAVPINVKLAGTTEIARKSLMVGINRPGQAQYEAAIRAELVMPEEVDPRGKVTIKLRITNQNKRTLDDIAVKLRSDLINYDQSTSLAPLEQKELTFDVKLDPDTPPSEDILQISLFAQDKNRTARFDVPSFKYYIKGYGDVNITTSEAKVFLVYSKNLTFTNTGNNKKTKQVHVPLKWYERFFVDASQDATLRAREDGYEIYWKLLIDQKAVQTVSYSIDYHPVFYAGIVLVVLLIIYYFVRSPIVVRKAAMVVESREGGISELKIMLRLKNRSRYSLNDLIILDIVPPIANVQKEFEVGSLRPLKIFEQPNKGSQLKWVMDSLGPRDERILSYKVRTKFSVLGSFRLPPAKVKYRFFGYPRSRMSNVENLFR